MGYRYVFLLGSALGMLTYNDCTYGKVLLPPISHSK